jgi:exonuclease III
MSGVDFFFDGWDRTCLDISSRMAEPFCKAWELFRYRLIAPLDPQKFDCCRSRIREIAVRMIIVLGVGSVLYLCWTWPVVVLEAAVFLAVGSKVLRKVGFALQKDGYTHVRGCSSEKTLSRQKELKVMTWNVCGIGGGMSLDHGGVISWRLRLNGLVDAIKKEDPDVLVLNEIYDTAFAESLIDKLKNDYAHFFIHLGPNLFGSESGVMILSKCATHHFSNTSFINNDWTLNRGFAELEIKKSPDESLPCARIIGTHLIHGDDPKNIHNRIVQIEQITNYLATQNLSMPTILAGDLNMDRDGVEGQFLARFLHPGYQGKEPTCTNRLVVQWDRRAKSVWNETIDYISLFKQTLADGSSIAASDKNIQMENIHLVKAFDESYNTRTALSDHHGIVATVRAVGAVNG